MQIIKKIFSKITPPQETSVQENKKIPLDKKLVPLNKELVKTIKLLRGENHGASIIIHGVQQRSGTNYIGQLISLHPEIEPFPNNIWEIPFLQHIDPLINFQKRFFSSYPRNRERIMENDLLVFFSTSFVRYLHLSVPEKKRMLLKVPSVDNLTSFFTLFPLEKLLIVIRDGRDVVSSTIKTWPEKDFSDVCRQWAQNMETIFEFEKEFQDRSKDYIVIKYEEAVSNPENVVKRCCSQLDLDVNKFPFDQINDIKVCGSSTNLIEGKVDWKPVTKSNNFNPIGRWKNWSNEQKNEFKKIAGNCLIKAQYCDNLHW